MVRYFEYSTQITAFTYILSILFLSVLGFVRYKLLSNTSQSKYLSKQLCSHIISMVDIIVCLLASIILFRYNSKTSIIALVGFIALLFASEILANNKLLYYILSVCLVYGSLAIRILSHGSHKGLTILIENYGFIVFAVISIFILVLLIYSRKRYASNYISRLFISASFALLIYGIFNDYVSNPIFLIVFIACVIISNLNRDTNDYKPFDLMTLSRLLLSSTRKQFLYVFPALLMITFSYILLGPFELYAGNQNEFAFSYTDFFPLFSVLGIVGCIVISFIVSIIPNDKIFKLVTTLIFSFGICSYIQNMFLNVKLHEEDGSFLNYDALKSFIILDTIIWVLLILCIIYVVIKSKTKWKSIVAYSSSFVCAIQTVAIISLLITTKPGIGNNNFIFTGEKELGIAKNNNIIILVLDSFGNKCLDKALVQFPGLLDGLNDFTYYSNANADYQRTFPSMSHMFTGYEMQSGFSDNEYLSNAWTSDICTSFFDDIHSSGYDFRLYTGDRAAYYGDGKNLVGKIDNVEISGSNIDKPALYKLLLKTSAFKYAPYICKHNFETVTWEFDKATSASHVAETDTDVYYELLKSSGLYIDSNVDNAITVKHLFALHDTDKVNEDVIRDSNASVEQCTKGVMVMLYEYLDQLKTLGKYDDSTIIITADHGQGLFDYDNPEFVKDNFDMQVVYFVKKANEHNSTLKISNAPIRHCDLMPTIIYCIDSDISSSSSDIDTLSDRYKKYGTTIFDHHDNEARERFFFYKTDKEYQRYDYIGDRDTLETLMEEKDYIPYKRNSK